MSLIRLNDFKGMIPRRSARMLPAGMAQVSHNARLEDGALAPFRQALMAHSFGTGQYGSIYRHQGEWLGWTGHVHAAPGPVAQDRLYFTGDGVPKMRVDGVVYPLALPPPEAAPDVENLDPFEGPELNDPDDDIIGWEDIVAPEPTDPDPGDPPAIPPRGYWRSYTIFGGEADDFIGWEWVPEPTSSNPLNTPPSAPPPAGRLINTEFPPGPTSLGTWVRIVVEGEVRWQLFGTVTAPDDETPVPQPGEPHRLVIIRQPEGGLSGGRLVTLPALVVLDVNGDLIPENVAVTITARVESGVGGVLSGDTRLSVTGGIARFRTLALRGTPDEPYVLRFAAQGCQPVSSDEVRVAEDLAFGAQSVVFAYTLVTQFGEESPPSPVSEILDLTQAMTARLSGLSAPTNAAARGITHFRIYRSLTSASGITDLYFVAEIPIAQTTFDHDLAEHPLAEVLPSADYDPPPDDMTGLVALPNGMMAAFAGKEVLFSEPFKPHAWPSKYRLLVDFEIVGMVGMGSALAVITRGTPYVAQGYSPEAMVMEKMEAMLPCIAPRSIVDLGMAAAYASHDGLVLLGPGMANVVTTAIFTRDQWRDLRPETFVAENLGRRYLFSHEPRTGEARRIGLLDLSGQENPYYMTAEGDAAAFYRDIENGEIYFLEGGLRRVVREFNSRAAPNMTLEWRSRKINAGALQNFGAILVVTGETGDENETVARIDLYADGVLVHSERALNVPARLPSGFLSSEWEVAVTSNVTIHDIWIASEMGMLAQAVAQ